MVPVSGECALKAYLRMKLHNPLACSGVRGIEAMSSISGIEDFGLKIDEIINRWTDSFEI